MFSKIRTRTRGALVLGGVLASLAAGVALAPGASAMPIDHRCDTLVHAIYTYQRFMNDAYDHNDWDTYYWYYNAQIRAVDEAESLGCVGAY